MHVKLKLKYCNKIKKEIILFKIEAEECFCCLEGLVCDEKKKVLDQIRITSTPSIDMNIQQLIKIMMEVKRGYENFLRLQCIVCENSCHVRMYIH